MRIVKITGYYKFALKYYYEQNPQITDKSYNEQHKHLMSFGLGWANHYSKAFNKLGAEAFEIVHNASFLQKKWAEENNSTSHGNNLVLEQLKALNPDVVWFQDSFSFSDDFLKTIKIKIPNLKIIIGNCCNPYSSENLKTFSIFDFITTCSPVFIDDFNKYGIKNILLYHAIDKDILQQISSKEKTNNDDVVFVGSIIPRKGFHLERKNFIERIAAKDEINFKFYGNLYNTSYTEVLKLQLLYALKKTINFSGIKINSSKLKKIENLTEFTKYYKYSKDLKNKYHGAKYGIDMFRALAKSKLTFDIQGEIGGDYAATMRLFEATGVGTVLIEENKKNIPLLFEPDKEIVTFDFFDEAMEKIIFLLENEKKTSEIAKAGQIRTLKDHTYKNRAEKLLREIKKHF
ncbi:MAG: glycosyltransferase [Bacteroidota bacterium]|nr:glycosyltransferase [Bacteroidota bacterium]